MAPTMLKYILGMLFPPFFMGVSIFYFATTLLSNPLLTLRDFSAFKEKAFARLWLKYGPMFADDIPQDISVLLAQCRGLVLDVGPGSGEQLKRFTHPENITAIYGVEPGVSLHAQLRDKAGKAGLGGKYHVLAATADLDAMIPQLIKAGLLVQPGKTGAVDLQLFDEIVCVRVLCGVPDQAASVADLYSLLKPGGRFVVCEHVLNSHHWPARLAQRLYMLMGWRQLMGGCCLTRSTVDTLLQVAQARDGGWAEVKISVDDEYSPSMHVTGVLTKKKK
ncbi:uncharacterized protein Z520_11318 [Fonsecaea multimorphosa CBS 102226]|uniref:Methyltransferase domain-containing protein n=1 Tax=Fonsecaea multimorphosa CBS 102226 TaxID=1442371 RepID=A0A0D2GU65_9EURO|nr:uncharacterized protein Z520_11318 [Fonsecaea multimorphosa CBS 102226]KIX93045.1 hypothetical protein Z520_11318 [Fonsecaea multimorphosa CBS 102226]OAL18292.1 hypothetical protein AYO22_10870 [Fonsecaea multimorphosa]